MKTILTFLKYAIITAIISALFLIAVAAAAGSIYKLCAALASSI